MKSAQQGVATVEFAICGSVALLVLIGCLEIGRTLFVWNTIGEATRRAARLAAVCPMNDAGIARNAMMVPAGTGSTSAVLPGMSTANVSVTYLNAAGGAAGSYDTAQYVRVQISGYTHTLFIPYVGATLTVPPFATTLPVESLGYVPELGTRTCLGA